MQVLWQNGNNVDHHGKQARLGHLWLRTGRQQSHVAKHRTLPQMKRVHRRRLILASASPRRHAFLRGLGIPFVVQAANIDETPRRDEDPVALARRLAVEKAAAAAGSLRAEHTGAVVLAADTVVAQDKQLFGKPVDTADAIRMLRQLRNRPHQVLSGLCLRDLRRGVIHTAVNVTTVHMRGYADEEIAAYVATGDPMDKAGGYAIQHPVFSPVDRFDGCYAGVMGLPLADLVTLLGKAGIAVPGPVAAVCHTHGAERCCTQHSQ